MDDYSISDVPMTLTRNGTVQQISFDGRTKDGVRMRVTGTIVQVGAPTAFRRRGHTSVRNTLRAAISAVRAAQTPWLPHSDDDRNSVGT